MGDPDLSLRERKRRATRQAIQREAITLALEEGLAAVTIDEISRRADISPRTFFNYFSSKDDALLGEAPTLNDDDELAVFRGGGPSGDLMSDIGWLLVHATRELVTERDLMPERHRLLRENPELFSQRMVTMKEFHGMLDRAVNARLSGRAADPRDVDRHARLATLVALATLRHAWTEWSHDESEDGLEQVVDTAFADLGSLVSRTTV
jgi:AcrR family transcriptional regulator